MPLTFWNAFDGPHNLCHLIFVITAAAIHLAHAQNQEVAKGLGMSQLTTAVKNRFLYKQLL